MNTVKRPTKHTHQMHFVRPPISDFRALTSRRGMTLVETVVYIALFALLSVLAVSSLLAMGRTLPGLRASRATASAVRVVFDRTIREARGATGIVVNSSVLDATPGKLVFTNGVEVALSGTALTIKETSVGPLIPLTPASIGVSSFIARRYTTPVSEAVRIEMIIGGKEFATTIVLRGSYAGH